MIFGLFILVWVFSATTFWMLPLPLALTLARETYLDRPLKISLLAIPAVVASLILLYLLFSKMMLSQASLQAGKIFVSSVLLIQLVYGAFQDAPSYAWGLGTPILLLERCLILERKLILNAKYSFTSRRRGANVSAAQTMRLAAGVVLTLFNELLRLSDDIRRLYRSRGSNPVTSGWVVPRTRRLAISYADALLIAILGVISQVGLTPLMPVSFVTTYSRIFFFL